MQKLYMILFSKKRSLVFILFLSLTFTLEIPLNEDNEWEVLQSNPVLIKYKIHNNFPFCQSNKTIEASINDVLELLEDKKNYFKIFDRIEYSKPLTSDIVHIKIDMPFPFSGREYIVKYKKEIRQNNDIIFSFEATNDIKIPLDSRYVRLINASGAWILKPTNSNKTSVTYIWNGELLGDFPDWALTKAWIEQGNEVFAWIEKALN